jgi:hypothetical protein
MSRERTDAPTLSIASSADSIAWHLRVKMMSGIEHVVTCKSQDQTLVAEVKQSLELMNAAWPIRQQCLLVMTDFNERIEEVDSLAQDRPSKRPCPGRIEEESGVVSTLSIAAEFVENQCETMSEMQDDLRLSDYGLQNHAQVELLVKDLAWRDRDLAVQNKVMHGSAVEFDSTHNDRYASAEIDTQAAEAIATVLVRVSPLVLCNYLFSPD